MNLSPLITGIQRIKTDSVLAPLLALTVIVGAVALIATAIPGTNPIVVVGLWALFAAIVIFVMIQYTHWGKTDPRRLHSEDYQIEQQRLEMIGDERDPKVITITTDGQTANTAQQRGGAS